jgi:hypothetical protein
MPTPLTSLQIAAALVFVACLFALVGTWDDADQIEREAQVKVLRAERAAAARLDFPLRWDATVTQSLPSGREATTRYYSRTSQKEGK